MPHISRLHLSVLSACAIALCSGTHTWAEGPSLSGVVEEFDHKSQIVTLKSSQGTGHALSVPNVEIATLLEPGQRVTIHLNSEGAIEKIDPAEADEKRPPIEDAPRLPEP